MTSPVGPARKRLYEAQLYLVCDSRPALSDFEKFLAQVLEAGVDMIQLREKEMEAGPLMEVCEVARKRTAESEALFIVNDRLDVALASGADGVHLGQDDLRLKDARAIGGPGLLIGLSTHSPTEIDAALDSEADYIGVGPVHATPTKLGRPAVGIELVSYAATKIPPEGLPFFAIGGIDLTTIEEVLQAGARRVSVLRAIVEAEDPASVVRSIKKALNP
jgi:thiamine-phosphate pyrophosphorylase